MNASNPVAEYVAVRGDRVLGAGNLEELSGWGDFKLDDRFADKILAPGFVEGHSHTMEGALWSYVYCGFYDRTDPDGKVWPGLKSGEEILARLAARDRELQNEHAPISGWALDPIQYGGKSFCRADFDTVSGERPLGVLHASGHLMNVNTKALEMAGLLRLGINHSRVPLGDDGLPTGELKGPDAMMLVNNHVGFDRALLACDEQGLWQFARLCVRTGTTTATDLANPLPPESVDSMLRVTGERDFPTRIVSAKRFAAMKPADVVDSARQLRKQSSNQLRLGTVKVVLDGSMQGFTARLRQPGYFNGAPNGLWYVSPEQLQELYELALLHDVQVHIHNNGDEATDLALDMMERALRKHPHPDHRFTLQHTQMADAAQYRRMKKLGFCANVFANHHYFWGDQHLLKTVGPERAKRMNGCRTALREGVPLAIHSDAPVTQLGPLFTAWCAANRQTKSGKTIGADERISVAEALYAITLGASYTLKMDGEIGSIEIGKRADMAVLDDDPFEARPEDLKDVGVWGVVQGGRVFSAETI
ncbi:MAG: amidohydrolase [Pseudomonadota bacterium]